MWTFYTVSWEINLVISTMACLIKVCWKTLNVICVEQIMKMHTIFPFDALINLCKDNSFSTHLTIYNYPPFSLWTYWCIVMIISYLIFRIQLMFLKKEMLGVFISSYISYNISAFYTSKKDKTSILW